MQSQNGLRGSNEDRTFQIGALERTMTASGRVRLGRSDWPARAPGSNCHTFYMYRVERRVAYLIELIGRTFLAGERSTSTYPPSCGAHNG